MTSRVEQGAAPPLDRDMLRVEEQKLEADRRLQAGVVERRLVELKRLLGMPADATAHTAPATRGTRARKASRRAAPQDVQAVTSRADVLEAEARIRVAEAQIDRAQREGRPDVSLFGMYMRMDAGFPQQGFSPSGALERVRDVFHYWSAGAMVTLPIASRNQGNVAAAEAERTGAAAQLEAARLTAQAEIAAAQSRDEHARDALQAYSGDAIMLARQNLDVVRQTYELGRGTLLDVLDEQRLYFELERSLTDVLREATKLARRSNRVRRSAMNGTSRVTLPWPSLIAGAARPVRARCGNRVRRDAPAPAAIDLAGAPVGPAPSSGATPADASSGAACGRTYP